MRQAIEVGIQGFLMSCFADGRQPIDPDSGYLLTPDNSEARFVSDYPYLAIENTFLQYAGWTEDRDLTTDELQAWLDYFWQYAKLVLQERLPKAPDYWTAEMEARRGRLRQQFMEQRGYTRWYTP
jgi:hypothetical protein